MELFILVSIVLAASVYLFWRFFRKKKRIADLATASPCEGCAQNCSAACQPPEE